MGYIDLSNKKHRQTIYDKFGGRCAYCGHKISMKELSIDHIDPLRRKMNNCSHGSNEIDNLNPSCKPCNYSKSSLDLEKWRSELMKKVDRLERDSSTYRLCKRFGFVMEYFDEVTFYFERVLSGR